LFTLKFRHEQLLFGRTSFSLLTKFFLFFQLSSVMANPKRRITVEITRVVDGLGSVIRRGRSRHTMIALVCGLDVHKDSTYATILNSEGKMVDSKLYE
jgi:hypothetical protein